MKDELNRLVVATLERSDCLTARDIFKNVRQESRQLTRKGFNSFVKDLRVCPYVQPVELFKGRPLNYKLLK